MLTEIRKKHLSFSKSPLCPYLSPLPGCLHQPLQHARLGTRPVFLRWNPGCQVTPPTTVPPAGGPTLASPGRYKGLLWLRLEFTILLFLSNNADRGRGAHLVVVTLPRSLCHEQHGAFHSLVPGATPLDLHTYSLLYIHFCRNFRDPCLFPAEEEGSGVRAGLEGK